MGYPRLEVGKQCELAPTLLTAMEGKPQPQQDRWGLTYTHKHIQTHTQRYIYMIAVLIAPHLSLLLA